MARVAGKSKVYVDEFDYSGRTNGLEFAVDVNLPDDTTFDDEWSAFLESLYGSKLTLNGFFDPADDGYDEQMWGCMDGYDHYLGAYPGSQATHGSIGYELQAKTDGQTRPLQAQGAVLLNVEWTSSGPVVRSQVLCNGAVNGTYAVTNSNKNLGATGAGTVFVAILRVLSVEGTGSITVGVYQSQNDGSPDAYAALIMFDAATGVGVQRKTVVTATEAWKRVNVTAFSGFTSATILVVCGYEQGSYVAP